MDNSFLDKVKKLREEQAKLNEKVVAAKAEAIEQVKGIVELFDLSVEEVFPDYQKMSLIVQEKTRQRKPSPIKYRTPTGIEWTGKGRIKKEFLNYLLENGFTEKDIDLFRVDHEQQAAVPVVEEKPEEGKAKK